MSECSDLSGYPLSETFLRVCVFWSERWHTKVFVICVFEFPFGSRFWFLGISEKSMESVLYAVAPRKYTDRQEPCSYFAYPTLLCMELG